MPIAMDPNQRFEACLESDASVPIETRPVFVCRQLTAREWMELAGISERIEREGSAVAVLESVFSGIRLAIVDWRNMTRAGGEPWPFSGSDLENLLTPAEAVELFGTIAKELGSGGDTAKKFVSPSPSSTGNSAKSAASAGAKMSPVQAAASTSSAPTATAKAVADAAGPGDST